jgi:hypothetical protein
MTTKDLLSAVKTLDPSERFRLLPMPRPSISYDVLIASPSDTAAERDVISECIRDWNSVHANDGIHCRDLRWELDSVPAFGDRSQAVLNKQLVDNADILIGVFKTRLGTATGASQSGTVEEIEKCYRSGKPVMLYFSSGVIPRDHDPVQLQLVKDYQRQIMGRSLYGEFLDLEDLRRKVSRHLATTMAAIGNNTEPGGTATSRTDQPKEAQAASSCEFSPRALLLSKELSIRAFPVIQESSWSGEIELTVAADTSEIDSIFSRFRGHKEVIVVAYGFDVAVAKLRDVSRVVMSGKAFWRIQLDPIRTDFSNDMEMGTSGTSADEFAEIRVRRLLLNEKPMAVKSDKGDMSGRLNELTFESLIQGLNSIVKIEHSNFIDLHNDFGGDPVKFTEIAWISAIADLKLSAAIQHIGHLKLVLNQNILNVDFSGRRHRKYQNVPPYEINVQGSMTFPSDE